MIIPKNTNSIIVVGDLILDEYLIGKATRLSREAAVPVLERTSRHLVAGGAANPAVNLAALDASAISLGVVGDDPAGNDLRTLLDDASIDTDPVVVDDSRPTTVKTRIVAKGGFVYGQHLARIDYLERRPLDDAIETALADHLATCAAIGSAIVVSNYRNGVVTDSIIAECRRLNSQYGLPLIVDSQGRLTQFREFDIIKCNRSEAEDELGAPLSDRPDERADALARLRDRCDGGAVVVTLGSDGIAWLDEDGYGELPPVHRSAVFDTTGAGDTVIAVLALAHVAGFSLERACECANAAAGIVVQVLGNYAPTREQIETVLRDGEYHVPHVESALPL